MDIDLIEKSTPFVKIRSPDGREFYAKKTSLEFYNYTNKLSLLLPSGGQFNPQVGGSYVEVDLSNSVSDRYDNVFLSVTFTNTNVANAITLFPLQWIVDRFEIIANGLTLNMIYSNDLWTEVLTRNYSDLVAHARASNYSVATDGAVGVSALSIPALGSATYSLGFSSLLSQVYGGMLKTNSLKIRVYFNGGAGIVAAGPATIADVQANNVNIVVQGRRYNPEIQKKLRTEYRSLDHISRTVIRRQQIINIGPSVAVTELSQLLGSFSGNFSNLRVSLVYEDPTVVGSVFRYQPITNLSLIMDDGTPYSFERIDGQLITRELVPSKWGNINSNNLYELSFSRDPKMSSIKGYSTGGLYLNGRALIKFTPAAASAGTVTGVVLRVNALEYNLLIQKTNSDILVSSLRNPDNL